ncbi:unnamed protein product [Notodromas monacha]|uniref:DNA-(apurinic or apyrimidinic site) endonuclease 2 n=1 Tax=Notodromas monacha TaxID=399045 RepID=A0A7R9BUH9_9CRUS|nr:unnamed protein product [Notodromas monacha]CAG0920372.1 unnamed protein product [Notodromas monacha]
MPWKIVSWNVNGIRTLVTPKTPLSKWLNDFDADIVCFQETKISREALQEEIAVVPGYTSYFAFSQTRVGYSGVATYCKSSTATPTNAEDCLTGWQSNSNSVIGFTASASDDNLSSGGLSSLDTEGRCVLTEHLISDSLTDEKKKLFVFNVYVPRVDFEENPPPRLDYKMDFLRILLQRAKKMTAAGHCVIITGDLNVCISPEDHFDPGDINDFYKDRPDRQLLKSSLLNSELSGDGFLVDSFRKMHPDRKNAYSCWHTKLGLRSKNLGTRIDFVLTDLASANLLAGADVCPHVMGSDHCPVETSFSSSLHASVVCPALATKLWPQFARKQQKLTDFFARGEKNCVASVVQKREKAKKCNNLISSYFVKRQKVTDSGEFVISESASQEVERVIEDIEQESCSPPIRSEISVETSRSGNVSNSWKSLLTGPPKCKHGFVCVRRVVKKPGPNLKREFWSCPIMPVEETELNELWRHLGDVDEAKSSASAATLKTLYLKRKLKLSEIVSGVMVVVHSQNRNPMGAILMLLEVLSVADDLSEVWSPNRELEDLRSSKVKSAVNPLVALVLHKPSCGHAILSGADYFYRRTDCSKLWGLLLELFKFVLNDKGTTQEHFLLQREAFLILANRGADFSYRDVYELLRNHVWIRKKLYNDQDLEAAADKLVLLLQRFPSTTVWKSSDDDNILPICCAILWESSKSTSNAIFLPRLMTVLNTVVTELSPAYQAFLWLFLCVFLPICPISLYESAIDLDPDSKFAIRIYCHSDENGFLIVRHPFLSNILRVQTWLTTDGFDTKSKSSRKNAEDVVIQTAMLGEFLALDEENSRISAFGMNHEELLEALVDAGEKDPVAAVRMLPVFVATLSFKTLGSRAMSSALKLRVMQVLPKWAVHKACLKPLLNLIAAMRSQSGLEVMALRMMHELWKADDRCFGELESMLVQSKNDSAAWAIAKSCLVRDICLSKANKFGNAFLGLVVDTIKAPSGLEIHALCALDAVGALCKESVVDLQDVFEILTILAHAETRSLVISKIGEVIQLAADVERTSRKANLFVTRVLNWLWDLTCGTQVHLVNMALRTLGKFSPTDFKLSMVPVSFRSRAEIKERIFDEQEDFVSGAHILKMFEELNEKSFPAMEDLVLSMTGHEMRNMGKRAYTMGMNLAATRRNPENPAGEPMDYNYLDEKSLLKWVIRYLIEESRKERTDSGSTILICLAALNQTEFFSGTRGLPPLFWPRILRPLARLPELLCAVLDLVVEAMVVLRRRFSDVVVALNVTEYEENSLAGFLEFHFEKPLQDHGKKLTDDWLTAFRDSLTDNRVSSENKAFIAECLVKQVKKFSADHSTFNRTLLEIPPDYFLALVEAGDGVDLMKAGILRAEMVKRAVAHGISDTKFESNPLRWMFKPIDWLIDGTVDDEKTIQDFQNLINDTIRGVQQASFRMQWVSHQVDLILQCDTNDPEAFAKEVRIRWDVVIKSVITFGDFEHLLATCLKHSDVSISQEEKIRITMHVFALCMSDLYVNPIWEPVCAKMLAIAEGNFVNAFLPAFQGYIFYLAEAFR